MDLKIIRGDFEAAPERGHVSSLTLIPPAPRCLLGLSHGAGAGMEHANMEAIAQALASIGVATFRYQFSYMEQGKGRESAKVSIATVASAADAAHRQYPELPLLMGGHSYGGRMTSLAAAQGLIPQAKGIIFFNFPLHAPGKPGIERASHLPDIQQPMLFLSGSRDTFAQQDLLTSVVLSLGPRATLNWLDTANHGYKVLKRTRSHPSDVFTEIAEYLDGWLRQTI